MTGVQTCALPILLPETTFIRVMDNESIDSPETKIIKAQNRCSALMDKWDTSTPILKTRQGPEDNTRPIYQWHHALTHKLIIPPDDILHRQLMEIWHDHPAAGHSGRDETTRQILRNYHWPNARTWIADYIKGCATCQQMKNLTHRTKPPPIASMFRQVLDPLLKLQWI